MKTTLYRYFTGVNPPGPFVHVSLAAPGGGEPIPGQAAQLDTGADMSVLPQAIVSRLGLVRVRELRTEGLDGVSGVLSTVLVEMTVNELSPVLIETLVAEGERRVILGRDMLNRYKITLDGPAQALTVEEP